MKKFVERWKNAALLGMVLVSVTLAVTQDLDLALRIGVGGALALFAGLVGLELVAQVRRTRRSYVSK